MGVFSLGHTMQYLQITDWKKMQHYKKRNPPWVKSYADLLDNEDFYALRDTCKLIYFCLTLFASRKDNRIKWDLTWLSRQLPIAEPIGERHIEELIKAGFLSVCDDDSTMLADCYQDAIPETETESESEGEKSKSKQPPSKDKYLDFVLLTNDEYYKLVEKFGVKDTTTKIATLNEYIGSTGKKYKSHYHTILMWSRKDAVGKPQPKSADDLQIAQWMKNEDWLASSSLATLQGHSGFMSNLKNPKYRKWAIGINDIVKEITL